MLSSVFLGGLFVFLNPLMCACCCRFIVSDTAATVIKSTCISKCLLCIQSIFNILGLKPVAGAREELIRLEQNHGYVQGNDRAERGERKDETSGGHKGMRQKERRQAEEGNEE